jgi:hypothetical protein
MARFLIEGTHDEDTVACAQAVEAFLRTGSHFLTHADWGCQDGDHRAWIIVELDTKEEALNVVPPPSIPDPDRGAQLVHAGADQGDPAPGRRAGVSDGG